MITKDLQSVHVEGALSGDVIDMGIAPEATAHIMHQLAALYNDQILAVIREISTNGFDALVAALADGDRAGREAILTGKAGKAIEVTLPNKLAPIFMVRDYGVGLSYDDLVYVYSQFGRSTKRESNDYNGALGFGCKAPLAYTPQFTVQSVKNGLRNTIAMTRKPDGGGALTFPEKNEPTTEPAGTTVMVPVKVEDVQRFIDTARSFFLDWKPGTVLVNGSQPEHRKTKFRLTPELAVIEGDRDYILMANVCYPVGHRLTHGLRSGYALLAEVPTGTVEFSPSREGLKTTQDNRAVLDMVTQDFLKAAKGAIQRKINEAKTKADAMEAMIYWTDVMPAISAADTYTFQGLTLPSEWHDPKMPAHEWPFLDAQIRSSVESRHNTVDRIKARDFGRDIFVTGFSPGKFTANHKRRLNMWREATDAKTVDGARTWNKTADAVSYILVRADKIHPDVLPWIDPARIVSWEHVRLNYKLPTAQSGGFSGSRKTLMGSYDDVWTEREVTDEHGTTTVDRDGHPKHIGETLAKDLRQEHPLYYFQPSSYSGQQCLAFMSVLHERWTVVKLQANRVAKFRRDFPQAKEITTAAAAAYALWKPTITDDHIMANTVQNALRWSGGGLLKKLDPAKVDDPAIKDAIKWLNIDLTAVHERSRLFSQTLGKRASAHLPDRRWSNPIDSYPLVRNHSHHVDADTLKHTYIYLNAAFSA